METMNDMLGAKLIGIRPITKAERDNEGWDMDSYSATCVLEFDNGVKMYPSSDDEGNDAGTLFGINSTGESIYVYVDKAIRLKN